MFAHDGSYSDCKNVENRTISDKILKDRVYENAKNCKYDGCQGALASMVYKFFGKEIVSVISLNEGTSWRIT